MSTSIQLVPNEMIFQLEGRCANLTFLKNYQGKFVAKFILMRQENDGLIFKWNVYWSLKFILPLRSLPRSDEINLKIFR